MEKELQLIIDNMDFSGTKGSWFDHWSTEFDWEGEGNKSPEKKIQYLKHVLKFYNEAKLRLKKFPKDYQLWIEINESDSAKNAVFIHTANPNKSPFPLSYKGKKGYRTDDTKVAEFISKSKLAAAEISKEGDKVIVLFDPQAGIPPVNIRE